MQTLRNMWAGIWSRIKDEPVATGGIVQMGIAMFVAFGLGWTGEQVGAVVALSAALLSWIARKQTTPTANPVLPEGTVVEIVTPEGQPNKGTIL